MLHTSDVTVRNQVRTVVGAAEEWTYATVDGWVSTLLLFYN